MDFIQFAKSVENAGMVGPERLILVRRYQDLAPPQKGI